MPHSGGVSVEDLSFKSGGREVAATLYGGFLSAGVVLCPPHPLYGGCRHDVRLVSIARGLASRRISALCIDYSRYTGGREEVEDALAALSYLASRVRALGLLGYSYGAVVASRAAAASPVEVRGLVLLSPVRRVDGMELDLGSRCPKLLVYGRRDEYVSEGELEEALSRAEGEVERLALDTDHFYTGSGVVELVSRRVTEFFSRRLHMPSNL